jgi:arylsulfatase A-like enzyme
MRWAIVWGCCLLMGSVMAHGEEPARPNILLIVADDLGWNDVGYHGSRCRTPYLDQLARTGVELDYHYVQPVCSPTRTALLSGRYPSRFGPHATNPTNRRVFPRGTVTMASLLKEAGYHTYLAGKWHLGSRPEWGPNHYGFSETYGTLTGAADPWTHGYRPGPYAYTWHRNGELFKEEGNVTELIAAQAEKWIRAKPDPWFIYVPFMAVHIPIDTPPEYKEAWANESPYDDPAKNESFRRFAAFVAQLDAKIGQLVKALDETGQRENTLILFTSDNGGLLRGGNAYISDVPPTPVLSDNTPLRGQKAELFEGGIRVPALVNWPGKLEPRKLTTPMHVVDWLPTFAQLVGAKADDALQLDGQDIWSLLSGEETAPAERTFYWAHGNQREGSFAVRQGDWKLILRPNGRAPLFNLADDPYEKQNIAAAHPDRVNKLKALIRDFQQDDLPEIPEDIRDYPN